MGSGVGALGLGCNAVQLHGYGCSRDQEETHCYSWIPFSPYWKWDLHWENKEFELKYTRGINLKLESRCTVTRFSF